MRPGSSARGVSAGPLVTEERGRGRSRCRGPGIWPAGRCGPWPRDGSCTRPPRARCKTPARSHMPVRGGPGIYGWLRAPDLPGLPWVPHVRNWAKWRLQASAGPFSIGEPGACTGGGGGGSGGSGGSAGMPRVLAGHTPTLGPGSLVPRGPPGVRDPLLKARLPFQYGILCMLGPSCYSRAHPDTPPHPFPHHCPLPSEVVRPIGSLYLSGEPYTEHVFVDELCWD